MRAVVVLLLATLILSGCTANGGGGFETLHVVHDFAHGPRVTPVPVSGNTASIAARLEVLPAADPASCTAQGPVAILLLDPGGKEALSLMLAADSACAGGVVEQTVSARPGSWTLTFQGEAPLRGVADLSAQRAASGARLA